MPVQFKKRLIDKVTYEAASVFDVNNNGVLDIVCGEYWYEGPDFKNRHKICDVKPEDEYYNDFGDLPLDVNGDGYTDIVTGAWWEGTLKWRENPGAKGGEWTVHDVDVCGNIETLRLIDIDQDGVMEVFPNTPGAPAAFYKLVMGPDGKPTGQFSKHVIHSEPSGHGLGWGDIAGNGRVDIILDFGWLEAPADPLNGEWVLHRDFNLGGASVPVLTHDITGNGLQDLIVGMAHNYGLYWLEQKIVDGQRTWERHDIVTDASQFHDMFLVDLDRDGELELVTGKRYRAHCGHDPGGDDPIGLYYFKINGGQFEKHVIDYGPASEASGCGISFWIADLNGNGWLDIVAPGKEGLHLFENLGNK